MANNNLNEKAENALNLMVNRALAEERLANKKKARAEIINREIEKRQRNAQLRAEFEEKRKKTLIIDIAISIAFSVVVSAILILYRIFFY